jgi:hypothetical protein
MFWAALAHPLHEFVGHVRHRARPGRHAVQAADADGGGVEQRAQPARGGRDPRAVQARTQVGGDPAGRLERRHRVGARANAAPPCERRTNDGHGG